MTSHSSILTWRISWTEEPGGTHSTGSQSRTRLKQLNMHRYDFLSVKWEECCEKYEITSVKYLANHAANTWELGAINHY